MKVTASTNWKIMTRRRLGRRLDRGTQGIWVPSFRWMTNTMVFSVTLGV
jgi:hypothetical protein